MPSASRFFPRPVTNCYRRLLLPARAIVALLRGALVAAEERNVERVLAEIAQRGELLVAGDRAHHRILVVAVGEIGLRLRAREILEELDRRVLVGCVFRD